jgi:hypothetical protein
MKKSVIQHTNPFDEYTHYTENETITFMFINRLAPYTLFEIKYIDTYLMCSGLNNNPGLFTYDLVMQGFNSKHYKTVSNEASPRCLRYDNIAKHKLIVSSNDGDDIDSIFTVYSKKFFDIDDDLFPIYIRCPIPISAFNLMDILPKIYDRVKIDTKDIKL